MRQLRVAHFQADNTHNPSQQVQQSDALHEERDYIHAPPALVPTEQEECIVPENGKSSEQTLLLTVHRLYICKDMIEHFKDGKKSAI